MCASDEILLLIPLDVVARCLPYVSLCNLCAVSTSIRRDLAPSVDIVCRDLWESIVASSLVRAHYCDILEVSRPMELLVRRRWLSSLVEKTQETQWRTATAVSRMMNGVSLDGSDLFASLRRAFLASQVPELERVESVANWMHVLGAVEEQEQMYAKELAREAWVGMAGIAIEENLIWLVQTAHFVDDICGMQSWFEEAGMDLSMCRGWLEVLQRRLEAKPALGKYGPAGDPQQVRARHLSKLIAGLS